MTFGLDHLVSTHEQLRELYRQPGKLVIDKERPVIDAATREFIERSPFLLIGTVGGDGTADVSPRGGPSGFVQVLDETHLAITDLAGNNRLDTLENIIANGQVGLLFILPGRGDTVRVNGTAHLTTDPQILGGFTAELKPPKLAVVVTVAATFIHCAKAFQRSHFWVPETWAAYADTPDTADIVVAQQLLPDTVDASMIRADLAAGYAHDLEAEQAGFPA